MNNFQGDVINYVNKNGKTIMKDDGKGNTNITDEEFNKKVEEGKKKVSDNLTENGGS